MKLLFPAVFAGLAWAEPRAASSARSFPLKWPQVYLYDKRKQTTSNHHSRRMYLIKLLCDCSSTVLDKAFPREDILRRFMQSEREKRTKKHQKSDSDSDSDTETAKKNKIIV